jgi:hypothetical protein
MNKKSIKDLIIWKGLIMTSRLGIIIIGLDIAKARINVLLINIIHNGFSHGSKFG